MVQSRQGLWFPGSRRLDRSHRRGYFHPHGDGAGRGPARPDAGTTARSAHRGGQEGPDRGRNPRRLIARFAATALLAAFAPGLAACQPSNSGAAALDRSPAGLDQVPLTITAADGRVHRFTVEVARTPEQQQQGMMHRQSLAPDRGMIFPLGVTREASFWMKNTLIPLDIIFIRGDGTIANIEANAVPLSLDQVRSAGPVVAVLELAGGRAAELGVVAGDR